MSPAVKSLQDGLVIVFEGIDGVGKTTQLEHAQAQLEAEGWPLYISRNLGGTPIGEELRRIILSPLPRPETTNLYISVAIQEALVGAIESERAQGKLILMDRGPLSLAAYEIYGSRLDPGLAWPHVENGMSKLGPELTIIYDADVETALRRTHQKPGKSDYFEIKSSDYFERVAEGYKRAAQRYDKTCVIIDAGQSIEAVHEQTMRAIRQVLALHPHSAH